MQVSGNAIPCAEVDREKSELRSKNEEVNWKSNRSYFFILTSSF